MEELVAEAAKIAVGDVDEWAKQISDVSLICSSSRGGSSVLFRALARSSDLLSPRGEESVFMKLLPSVAAAPSDAVWELTPGEISAFRRMLAADIGVGIQSATTPDLAGYLRALAFRLPLQWPRLSPEVVRQVAVESCDRGWTLLHDRVWDAAGLFREVVGRLADAGLVDPRYYDRDPLLDRPLAEDAPTGPPRGGCVVEEPPYIPILARQTMPAELPRVLLLKSPALCHRLEVLPMVFPNARIRVLHLVRSPAATTNGLVDGWLHWGFFSRDVSSAGGTLDIRGYSDRFPWGDRWWNFDVPADWADHAAEPLPLVCSYQWAAAHRAVLRFVGDRRVDHVRIDFERLLGDPEVRDRTLAAAAEFVGVRKPGTCAGELPGVLMATHRPDPGRWRRRGRLIVDALRTPLVREQIEALDIDPSGWES